MSGPVEILDLGAAGLAREIAAGRLAAREAAQACIARLESLQPTLNGLVAPRYEAALREAAAADARRARGEPLGPLHGVPLTIKECFQVAGTAATMGLTARRDWIDAEDGLLVDRLRAAGAILLGKTNVSQLMVLIESDNPLFGRTNNPWNSERTCGGSSGGEAALVAARGSPAGLGSDLGGSIRIPCHFCGIHGLKPTSGLLPETGAVRAFRGMEAIRSQAGPMSRHVADLKLLLSVLAGDDRRPTEAADAATFGRDGSALRVGFWEDDGYFPASPAIRRAVREAAAAFAAAGARVEPFVPPEVRGAMRTYFGILGADGGADFSRWLEGSVVDARVARLVRLAGTPPWLRPFTAWLLQMWGEPWLAELFAATGGTSADGYWQLTAAAREYERSFARQVAAQSLDLLLGPPFALPAFPHGRSLDLLPAASYAMLINLLGWPSGVVAATRVRPGEESDRPAASDVVGRQTAATEQGSSGLPVGVQVVAKPWHEARLLAAMALLEAHFRAQPDYPAQPEPA